MRNHRSATEDDPDGSDQRVPSRHTPSSATGPARAIASPTTTVSRRLSVIGSSPVSVVSDPSSPATVSAPRGHRRRQRGLERDRTVCGYGVDGRDRKPPLELPVVRREPVRIGRIGIIRVVAGVEVAGGGQRTAGFETGEEASSVHTPISSRHHNPIEERETVVCGT